MSAIIDGQIYRKLELAKLLRAIADWIEFSNNKSVTIHLSLIFDLEKPKIE